MAMVHDLFFDSEEVPFTHETSFQEISLGKCLELLNEEQLSQLINVVAEDYQLKYDLFRQIQKQSVALEEFGKLHQPRSGSCAFCWQAFRIFRREIICNECPRNVCNRCESKGLCKYCHEMRILSYKKAELGILVPFEKDLFGYCKMITLGDPLAFQLRATLGEFSRFGSVFEFISTT
uniref:Uncharacterized protein n=1 Tax=Acrobeloides nanus TaxID=290746 RepID=A0A914E5K3_9BILA